MNKAIKLTYKTRLSIVTSYVKLFHSDSPTAEKDAEAVAKEILEVVGLPYADIQFPIPCQISEEGLRLKYDQRQGVIVGESRDRRCWWIKWNGLKTVYSYYKGYIEIIESNE